MIQEVVIALLFVIHIDLPFLIGYRDFNIEMVVAKLRFHSQFLNHSISGFMSIGLVP